MLFFNVFFRTLGFLSAFLIFFIVINIIIDLTDNIEKNQFSQIDGDNNSENIIATVNLNGPILNNSNYVLSNNFYNHIDPIKVKSYLDELSSIKIKVLIININSPGGTVSATNELENILHKFKKDTDVKIYFFTKEILASGGYWIATTADKIFASYGSIVGSIGVSGPSWFYYDTPVSLSSGFLSQSIETKNGIEVFNQNAGPGKDLFNPFRRPEEEEIKHLQNIVNEVYDDFIMKVSKSRKVDISFVKKKIGALIYSGKQAKDIFLVDEILNFEELLEYIIKENNFNDFKIYENKLSSNFFENLLVNYSFKNTKYSYNNFCKQFNNSVNVLLISFLEEC